MNGKSKMLTWILSHIIENTFETEVGKDQYKNEEKKCLDVIFSLYQEEKENVHYPKLVLRIFAEHNYVAVLTKETWKDDEGEGKDSEWKLYSYHDSCWRTDGVDRVISDYQYKLNTIGEAFKKKWYEITTLLPQDIDEIKKIRRKKYGHDR